MARTRGRGGATTVVYGHLDVKPPGPGWTTPPFRPVRLGHRLQARGASDDKGQVMAHLVALRAWVAVGGPPGDVVTIVDGAEEVGSPGSAGAAGLRATCSPARWPACVVVDTRAAGPVPADGDAEPARRGAGAAGGGRGRAAGARRPARRGGGRPVAGAGRACSAAPARELDRLPLPPSPWPAHPTAAAIRSAAGGRAVHADDLPGRATRRGVLTVNRLRAGAAAGAVPTRAEALDRRAAAARRRDPPTCWPGSSARCGAGCRPAYD